MYPTERLDLMGKQVIKGNVHIISLLFMYNQRMDQTEILLFTVKQYICAHLWEQMHGIKTREFFLPI